jgi:hypothetical protein
MSGPIRASVRLNPTERKELLEAIAMRSDSKPESSRRREPRFTIPESTLIVGELHLQEGSVARVIIPGRDISRGGMSFFHNCYLHPGTPLRVAFADGEKKSICERTGIVRRCEHVKGTLHDVSVKFGDALPVPDLMRIINRVGDPSATCKYPALLSLTQELVEMVRTGTPLGQVLTLIDQLSEHLRKQMPATSEAAAPSPPATPVAPAAPNTASSVAPAAAIDAPPQPNATKAA